MTTAQPNPADTVHAFTSDRDLGVTPPSGLRAGGPCSGCGSWSGCVCEDDARPTLVDEAAPTPGLSRAEARTIASAAHVLRTALRSYAAIEGDVSAVGEALALAVRGLDHLTATAFRAAKDASRPADEAERVERALQATLAAEHEARWAAAGVSL